MTPLVTDSNPAVTDSDAATLVSQKLNLHGTLHVLCHEGLDTDAYVRSELWGRRNLCCHCMIHIDNSLGWPFSKV